MNLRLPAFILILSLFSIGVQAQNAGVYVDIGPCMAMENDADRYNCYDLLEAQVRAAQARQAELPVLSIPRNTRRQEQSAQDEQREERATEQPAPAVATQDRDDRDGDLSQFGTESPKASRAREATSKILENDDGEQELHDTIAKLEQKVPNQWIVTLASGQVWTQINSHIYRLREGMEVRIYPSPFGGSFRLTATNLNGFIQVRRIK